MKVFVCDVCGKEQQYGHNLTELMEEYQIAGVTEVCDSCRTMIHDAKRAMGKVLGKIQDTNVRSFIGWLKTKLTQRSESVRTR